MKISTRDVSLFFFGQLFQQIITFASGLLIARWLGPQEYGSLGLARNIYAIALVLGPLGLDVALLRLIPQTPDAERPKLAQRLRGIRLLTLLANSIIVVASLLAAGPLQQGVYRAYPHLALYLAVTMAALPFAADLTILGAVYRTRGNTSPQILLTMIVQPLVRVVVLVGLILAGLGVAGVVISNLVASLVTFLLLSADLFRRERQEGTSYVARPILERRHLGAVFSYSLWLSFMAMTYNMLRNVDVLVLSRARTADVVGNYVALSVMAQVIQIYPQALSQTLGPTVASAYAAGDFDRIRAALNEYLRRASLIVGPLAGGLAAFGPWLDLLFGKRFEFSPTLCAALSLAYCVSGILAPMGFGLSMTGRHRREFLILILGSVFAVVSCMALSGPFGAVGVAVGVTAAYVLINVARAASTARAFGFIPGEWPDLAPPLIAYGAGWLIRSAWDLALPHTLISAIPAAGLYLAVIGVVYATLLLRPDERNWLTGRLQRLGLGRSRAI
jgi:O-antigen/teichoic acid export membrane protein